MKESHLGGVAVAPFSLLVTETERDVAADRSGHFYAGELLLPYPRVIRDLEEMPSINHSFWSARDRGHPHLRGWEYPKVRLRLLPDKEDLLDPILWGASVAQFMSSMEWHWLQIFGPPHEYSEIDDWIGFRAWIFRKLCVDKQRTLLRAEVLSIIPEHLRAKRLTGSRHAKRFYRIGRRDGFLCSECGYSGKNLHLHEVIPIARGGKPVEDNQKILCRSCNSRRGASIPVEHSTPKIQSWKKWYEEMCRL